MKFDQIDLNNEEVNNQESYHLKEKNMEDLGLGISALLDALYAEDGSLRSFSDKDVQGKLSEITTLLKNLSKAIRTDHLNIIKGSRPGLSKEDCDLLRKILKSNQTIVQYFWYAFAGMAITFMALTVWLIQEIIT